MIFFRSAAVLASLACWGLVRAEDGSVKVSITVPASDCTRTSSPGDVLGVTYRGTLAATGTEFDSNLNPERPFVFTLGQHRVIQGWEDGLIGMCEGEGRKIEIPPSLAYGDRGVGQIPPGSTLIFDVHLISLKPDPTRPQENAFAHTSIPPPPPPVHHKSPPSSENPGECKLLGHFSLFVQGAMGLLATGVLVAVRHFEKPQRPLKVWFFDVSKQVVGSSMMHLANLGLSMLSSGQWDFTQVAPATSFSRLSRRGDFIQSTDANPPGPNPCSFYLLNLGIDATIGVFILVVWLGFWHRLFLLTPLANPPLSIKSGVYDYPRSRTNPNPQPRVSWWLRQCLIYFLSLFSMKFCVFLMFHFFPWIVWFGDWALKWTEGNQRYQIFFVMFIFPLIMNAFQLGVTDMVIKLRQEEVGPGHGEYHHDPGSGLSDSSEHLLSGRSGASSDSHAVDPPIQQPESQPLIDRDDR